MPRAQKPKGWTGSGVPPSYRLPDSYREQVLRDLNRDDTIDSKNPKTLKLFKLIEGAFISYYCWREGFDRKPTPASRLRELAFLRKQVHETHEALAQLPTAVRMDILRAIADRHPKNPDWHKKTGDTPKKIVHL